MSTRMKRRDALKAASAMLGFSGWMGAQETVPVGRTKADQERNKTLLRGYDYEKYIAGETGYTGQDRQKIAFLRWEHAVRTRVGPRGNYKAGMARLRNGKLVLAVCHNNNNPDPRKNYFLIRVYESSDVGLTWQEIGKTPLFGKEPCLTAVPDGTLVLTAERGYFGIDSKPDENHLARSEDGGRTWETRMLSGNEDYPRRMIVEPDGSLLMIRALRMDWALKGGGSPNLELGRSRDGGKTWEFSEGIVDWDYPAFGEIAALRLRNGRYLAALRRQVPGTTNKDYQGFQDTVVTESRDGGKHWSKPWKLGNNAEVQTYLTELKDGRILATYSNYHLPWGAFAVLSKDGGRTWDLQHPIQLALSSATYVGWSVTLQLPDESLITSYATTTYIEQPPNTTTCEVVRWRLTCKGLEE